MPYILPQVKVSQEFQQVPTAVANPLFAFIFGESYNLFRYTDAEEKLLIGLGQYDSDTDTGYLWPNRPAGSVVDQDFTRLFFDSAWLEYFRDLVGTGHEIKAVEGFPNRINSSSLFFATANGFNRSSEFMNRDVKVGDGAVIKGSFMGEDFETVTLIKSLIADVVPSVTEAPEEDAGNAPATSENSVESLEAGAPGTVTFASDPTGYNGAADGNTVESYFLTVTVPGAFGVAQLRITSASGNDDVVDPIVPVDGVPFAVGSRGLTGTFTTIGSITPFEDGQIFRIDVNQDWTKTTAALDTGSNYLGSNDGTYIVLVTKGGTYAENPEVFVTSTGTLDDSGPYEVVDGIGFTIPTGVKIKFSGGTGLVKNDRYYIDVTAVSEGAIHTLELTNSLPDLAFGILSGGGGSGTPAPIDLDLSLSIIKNTEIPRSSATLTANWLTSTTEITINAGIKSTDSSWVNNLGTLLELPIIRGEQFSQFRSTRTDLQVTVGSIADIGDVETRLGPIDADNPLALGVFKALENANGTEVKFMATAGPDLGDFLTIIDAIFDRQDVYGLVPLTHDKEILDAVLAHALSSSTEERNRWRVMWTGAVLEDITPVLVTDSNGDILLATVLDDPDTSGTQFTRLRSDAAQFLTNDVKAGQTVRLNFIVNPATGEEQFGEFIIDEVLTQEELRLATGLALPITVPSRFEVHKTNTTEELADQVISQAGAFKNRRARVVFPDRIGNGGTEFDSIFLASSLAGLRSGVLAHQGLTNVQVLGYDDVSRTTELFGGEQLNRMADNGVWIVSQDNSGQVFTRHQLTTDSTDINTKEDSLVATIDSISRRFFDFFTNNGYIGLRNITPDLLAQLRADFGALVTTIQLDTDTERLGPQILTATLVTLVRHPTLLDTLIAEIEVDLPEPFNNFNINLLVLAQ